MTYLTSTSSRGNHERFCRYPADLPCGHGYSERNQNFLEILRGFLRTFGDGFLYHVAGFTSKLAPTRLRLAATPILIFSAVSLTKPDLRLYRLFDLMKHWRKHTPRSPI